ncbi:MAG TPA: ParB/Srx family N-terminal domain-containing protein [Candidatus Acidoferrum sp.]|nr:ParB/Srx family N-terminal domain-containing protein [Candidatus Acidoferrum sp.]
MTPKTENSPLLPESKKIAVTDLLLDPNNPRLGEYGIKPDAAQADLLKVLWEKMAVEELAMSIAYNGYFQHEPLLVEKNSKGELIVIEGNRRLAAVKLLLSEVARRSLRATDLPKMLGQQNLWVNSSGSGSLPNV